jgi:hypothetical protein
MISYAGFGASKRKAGICHRTRVPGECRLALQLNGQKTNALFSLPKTGFVFDFGLSIWVIWLYVTPQELGV